MQITLEFDASEMSSSEFIRHVVRGDCPLVAIPVFPSRVFRHGYIAIDTPGDREPKDLAGKRIGVPLYAMTAAIFIRGLLQHDHGVDLSGVHLGRGRHQRHQAARRAARPFRCAQAGRDRAAQQRRCRSTTGSKPATSPPSSARACRSRSRRNPNIVRLFPDYRAREKDYYRRTKIFPIMHLVVHPPRRLREASVRGDEPVQRLLRGQGDRAPRRCASSARCATCCRGWPPEIEEIDEVVRRRSLALRHRAEPARRSKRWCNISPIRR